MMAVFFVGLFLSRSADGAGICAGAAFDADFRIDLVLAVAFADCGNRALCSTGAAADAFIGNFVSHCITSYILYSCFYARMSEKIIALNNCKINISIVLADRINCFLECIGP